MDAVVLCLLAGHLHGNAWMTQADSSRVGYRLRFREVRPGVATVAHVEHRARVGRVSRALFQVLRFTIKMNNLTSS